MNLSEIPDSENWLTQSEVDSLLAGVVEDSERSPKELIQAEIDEIDHEIIRLRGYLDGLKFALRFVNA